MKHMAEALKRHMNKAQDSKGDDDGDRAPSLGDSDHDGDEKGPGDMNIQRTQLGPQHPADPNMHPDSGHMARSGGTLAPDEHSKIMEALQGVASPVGRAPNSLQERAKMAAMKARGK